MKLIDSKTRLPLAEGQKVTTFRGEEFTLVGWKEPHKPSSSGFVYAKGFNGSTREFYPEVIGAEFYPRGDRVAKELF